MKRLIMDKLVAWQKKGKRKPLLLIGVRQVGKTYILRTFGEQAFRRVHYVNFEKEPGLAKLFERDLDPKRIVQELSFYLNTPIRVGEDVVIFDEIQECAQALTSLKYFQEELPELHVCGAGSLLGVHLAPVSFPVGKVEMLHLYPMTFQEFLEALGEKRALAILETTQDIPAVAHERLWELLKHYFVVGGMPEVVATYCEHRTDPLRALALVREMQESLLAAYFADMAKHSGKVNAMHLNRLFSAVPTQLEKQQDGSAAKFKFKGVIPGVSHYQRLVGALDWLTAAGLVIKVPLISNGYPPLSARQKENSFKLFLFDIGMLGSMSQLSPQQILHYDYGTYKGYFAENFVAQELIAAHHTLFSWQENRSEVEFVIEHNGTPIPIEVKAGGNTKAISLALFTEKYAAPTQIILSARPLNALPSKLYLPLYLTSHLYNFLPSSLS